MAAEPEISVVVPVFNGENYLGACLSSVALAVEALAPEERERVEVIVCDNHSTDASRQIAEAVRFACASRIVSPPQHEENRTRNWAHGLGLAEGRWTMMLHHDDLMAVGGLATQLDHCTRPGLERVTMIAGRHRVFSEPRSPGLLRPVLQPEGTIAGSAVRRRVLAYHCPFVPFTLFRRAAYEAVGGLDPRWQLVQDWVLWMRLLERGDLRFHSDEVGWWRQHGTGPGYRAMNAREHVELAAELQSLMPTVPPRVRARAREIALDRAALQLAEVEGADVGWLDGVSLPPVPEAQARHGRRLRRVSASMTLLRLGAMAAR
ncbi:MAG TPA: glycosyltransferase [Solirubrobacterales bacterium]|nr:glycosyltransferase [Solirubrobacterales bacterium]